MTTEEAIQLVREYWDESGACASCGWHAALGEYDDLESEIDINEDKRRIEMRCLSKDDEDRGSHRGVRIYFLRPTSEAQR